MNTILKVDEIRLSKLNNAEYTNYMERTIRLIEAATVEKLGLTETDLSKRGSNFVKMNDLVAQSRISDDTARLATIDEERDNIVVYLMAEIENKRRSPISAIKEAAISLYNTLHVYTGIQTLPAQQETQQIEGFISDCYKAESMDKVTVLGLDAVIEQLSKLNREYAAITAQRTNNGVDTRLDNSKTVRADNDPIYDYITTMAFVTSVATPSAEATIFITHMNALIKETNTLYKQRTSKPKVDPNKPAEPSTDADLPAGE